MCIHKLELNFSDFCQYSRISEINFPKRKHIKISVKCTRFVSIINFEYKLISYISEHFFLMVLTGKKHRQIKFQYLQRVRIWAFGSLVHEINLLQEVLKQKFFLKKGSYWKKSFLCDGSILYSPFCLNISFWYGSFACKRCIFNLSAFN